jgi:hypothetical protein
MGLLDSSNFPVQLCRIAEAAALHGSWRTVVAAENALALQRRLRPDARKIGQCPFLFFGCGLADPTQGLFGVLPELLGF